MEREVKMENKEEFTLTECPAGNNFGVLNTEKIQPMFCCRYQQNCETVVSCTFKEMLKRLEKSQNNSSIHLPNFYYYIDGRNEVQFVENKKYTDEEYKKFHERLEMNNVFIAGATAVKKAYAKKIREKLKSLAEKLNGDKVFDWSDKNQPKWYILLNGEANKLHISHTYTVRSQGTIHCINPQFLERAIDAIGEKPLIEMFKAGV
jgi:hypothetical protein